MAIKKRSRLVSGPALGELDIDVALDTIPLDDVDTGVIDKLTDGDDSPCWVAMEILEGPGSHGTYQEEALMDVVNQVNEREPMGFLGHQKQEDLPYEFPDPTTHWFAAEFVEVPDGRSKAIIYGLVDQAFPDLRRWIRASRIKEISIYGEPTYETGTRNVTGYNLYSIDWAPRGRSGMDTSLLWSSEMEDPRSEGDTEGELDGSYNELLDFIREAVRKEFNNDDNGEVYVYAQRVFDDHIVAEYENSDGRGYWWIDYTITNETGKVDITFGDPIEVVEEKNYIKVDGDGEDDPIQGEGQNQEERSDVMTIAEMLADIRAAIAKGEYSRKDALNELGITGEQALELLDDDRLDKLEKTAEIGVELIKALGFSAEDTVDALVATAGEMFDVYSMVADAENPVEFTSEMCDVYNKIQDTSGETKNISDFTGELLTSYTENVKKANGEVIDSVIKEKVTGEQSQKLIRRLLTVSEQADEETISGEVDSLLEDKEIKGMLSKLYTDKAPSGETKTKRKDKASFKSERTTRVRA